MPRVDDGSDNGEVAAGPVQHRLAVSLTDLDRMTPQSKRFFLGGRFAPEIVRLPRNEPGVLLTCPLLEACQIMETVRGHDREAGEHPTRCYVRRLGRWVQVGQRERLVVQREGFTVPNPRLFPGAVPRPQVKGRRLF